jgi:hypothetical protein
LLELLDDVGIHNFVLVVHITIDHLHVDVINLSHPCILLKEGVLFGLGTEILAGCTPPQRKLFFGMQFVERRPS